MKLAVETFLIKLMNFVVGGQIIESNFTVISTDYESYAVISNCDEETNDGEVQFTQHVTLWSRTRDLANDFVDNVSHLSIPYSSN